MNTSTIQLPPLPQVSWSTVKTQEKEADFLSLRLLNKRIRVRISAQPLDLSVHDGKGNYFVVSNVKGWFAAVARNVQGGYLLAFSPLSDLRGSIVSSKTEGEDDFASKRLLPVAGAPIHLALALNDERLVVGSADGSISIFDTSVLFSPGSSSVEPLQIFPPASPGPLRHILGNPGDLPELVAIRRDAGSGSGGMAVEVIDVKHLQSVGGWRTSGAAESIPTSIVWSARGKQLAIGLRNGDIVTYSPTDTSAAKLHVPKPPSVGDSSVITVLWLTNQAFYGIYVPPDDPSPEVSQKHVLTLFDPKSNTATQTELETPYYPSPALRPPGAFTVVMRNWNPAKLLVFVGDSTSSDIGLVGSVLADNATEAWCNLTLEETSTPSVPLDKDAEDTVPLALDMDLSSGQGAQDSSSSPILYLYASDGTLQAWFVSNEKGGPYPGMVVPSASSTPSTSQTLQVADQSPASPSLLPQSSTTMPTFGSTGIGTSTFEQKLNNSFTDPNVDSPLKPDLSHTSTPGYGTSVFGQQTSTPSFGQASAFGQPANISAFGNSTQSALGQGLTNGFGSFASSGPTKFGSPGFGFGSPTPPPPSAGQPTTPAKPPEADVTSPEADMAEADDGEADKLGGLSLAEINDTSKSQSGASNNMFGPFAQSSPLETTTSLAFSSGTNSSNAFGSAQGSGFVRPASGFGSFLKPVEAQSASKDVSSDKELKPSPAFGTTNFGAAKPQSAFGQPAFGQPSSFGTPSTFGMPSAFGSLAAASSSKGTNTGGFSAFAGASKGFSSFAQGGTSGFDQHAQSLQTKPSEAPSIAMESSSEDSGKGSSSSITTEQKPPSSFGTLGTANSAFTSGKPSPSPFASGTPADAFGTSLATSSFSASGQLPSAKTQEQQPSPFRTSTARGQSPTSSPEGSPNLGQRPKPDVLKDDSSIDIAEEPTLSPTPSAQSTTPFGTPTSSAFRATGSVPSGGAFGNLIATPSAFKPSEGFGAFGSSAKVSSTSPFANSNPVVANAFSTPIQPASAFGVGGSGPASASQTPGVDSTTPKFGSPSTPSAAAIFGKSSFGTPSTPSPTSTTPLTTPAGNAFSAYSGSGGFSAFAKAGKPSFSELLRSQKDEDISSTSSKGPAVSKEKKEEELFVTVSKPEELDQENLPPTPSTHGTFDEEDQNLGDGEDDQEDAESFISESFSGGSDGGPEGEEGQDEEEGESEEQEPVEEIPSRAKTQSPATIPLPSSPDSRDSTPQSALGIARKESTSSAGASRKSEELALWASKPSPEASKSSTPASTKAKSPKPILIQLPDDDAVAKKFSTPPKSPPPLFAKPGVSAIPTLFGKTMASAEKPLIGTISPPSPPLLFGEEAGLSDDPMAKPPLQSVFSKPALSVREGSTTPPGSPSVPEDKTPLPAPKPVVPSSSAPLSLGRPNSRPTRSSPLAGTPVSGEESKEVSNIQSSQSVPSLPTARLASPKLPFGQIGQTPAAAQQKPVFTSFIKPEEKQAQSAALLHPVLPSNPPQPAAVSQGPSTTPMFKPPTTTQTPFPCAGNAPFIMPPTAPASLSDRLGLGVDAVNANDPKVPGASTQPVVHQLAAQSSFESSMQRECKALYMSMVEEFEQLAVMSKAAVATRTLLGRSSTLPHSREDFKDKAKWSFGDLETFGKLIKGLENDVLVAHRLKDEFTPLMREVESNLLKAQTRREEIVRFSKAKADPEFAKMLKARTLGPDAAETQSQLRRQIRLINDRVEQLEVHLKSCKKKLEENRRGKSSIKPPSLDTVNRTYRNIDLAIKSQTEQIEVLTSRVAKLDLDVALHSRLPLPQRRLPRTGGLSVSVSSAQGDYEEADFRPQVTPSIAASTAAALNAERSALRLKNALANARKTPLLNTQAAEPTKRIPTLDNLSAGYSSDARGGFPADLDSALGDLREREDAASENQRRPTRHAAHQKSVRLGKTHMQVPPSITTFDWGPLPKARPMTSLPSDIRPESIARKASF